MAAGEDIELVARQAVSSRNALKVLSRKDAPRLVRSMAEKRNFRAYGNPIGPTYDGLVRGGRTPEQIIFGAGRTNPTLNRLLKIP